MTRKIAEPVWITGASSGLGRELAEQLVRAGYRVIGSARSEEALDEIAAASGGLFAPLPLDVTDSEAVRRAVEGMDELPGTVVLNAGTYIPIGLDDFDGGKFEKQVDVNLFGAVHVLDALLPHYREAHTGHIVFVASVAGYRGLPQSAAYGPTKAAVINLAEGLKLEGERAGIKIQLVNPGFVKTPLTDKNEFKMPYLMPVEKAAARMIAGMKSGRFEITFPKRFTWQLKLLQKLPYGLYFWITRRVTKVGRS